MIRIEMGESSPSRRTPTPPKQKPARRPSLLKRIFGKGNSQPKAKCIKTERCPCLVEQEMLMV